MRHIAIRSISSRKYTPAWYSVHRPCMHRAVSSVPSTASTAGIVSSGMVCVAETPENAIAAKKLPSTSTLPRTRDPCHGSKNQREWEGTKIMFEIARKGSKTEVRFTHVGLNDEHECFNACSEGWGFYVKDSLRKLITTGKGDPDTKANKRPAQEQHV